MNSIQIGYELINTENYHDHDKFLIENSDDYYYYRKFNKNNREDTAVVSTFFLKKYFDFELQPQHQYLYMFMYQLDKTFNPDAKELNFDYIKNKDKIQSYVNKFIEEKKFNYNKNIISDTGHITKLTYHIIINLFFLKNNEMKLTDSQLNIIKRIHDDDLTWEEYFKLI